MSTGSTAPAQTAFHNRGGAGLLLTTYLDSLWQRREPRSVARSFACGYLNRVVELTDEREAHVVA